MSVSVSAILLVGLSLAGADRDVIVRPGPRPLAACQAVSVLSPDKPKLRSPFSARRVLDLQFKGALDRRLTGAHRFTFKVFTPHGHLYQNLSVSFRAEADKVKGRPARGSTVLARFPVAGTSITTSSLFGQWRVVPYLDGDLRPCGAATRFRITR